MPRSPIFALLALSTSPENGAAGAVKPLNDGPPQLVEPSDVVKESLVKEFPPSVVEDVLLVVLVDVVLLDVDVVDGLVVEVVVDAVVDVVVELVVLLVVVVVGGTNFL